MDKLVREDNSNQVNNISKLQISRIPPESVVDVFGTVVATDSPITSATQQDVELAVRRMYVVSASAPELPFQLDDASRPGSEVDHSVETVAETETSKGNKGKV